MNIRRSLVIAASVSVVTAGIPAYAYLGPGDTAKVSASAAAAKAPSKGDFVLRKGGVPKGTPSLATRVAKLDKALTNTTATKVLASANRAGGGNQPDCSHRAELPSSKEWYCFERGDQYTQEWIPQGVSTISDAQKDEKWGGKQQPVLLSWYDGCNKKGKKTAANPTACPAYTSRMKVKKGVRLSFFNRDSGKYRHVSLVYPFISKSAKYKGKANYQPVNIHAGGIAWYGNYLYVADTARGVRVFSMKHILDLGASKNGSTKYEGGKIGLRGKTYYAAGNRYVMPQVDSWVNSGGNASGKCGDGKPRFSYLSIYRSGADQLASGEYCNKSKNGRIATWPLIGKGAGAGQLKSSGGKVRASNVARLPFSNIQGAAGAQGKWVFAQSHGNGLDPEPNKYRGELHQALWRNGKLEPQATALISRGPEDLSCWRGRGEFWTVGEHAGYRALYGMRHGFCKN